MKEIIIYGGAFNPPTIAHQTILQACVDRANNEVGEVWLLPSGDRADKKITTKYSQRVRLAEALCASVVKPPAKKLMRVETMELEAVSKTETYQTHQALCQRHPDKSFRWVFGTDSVLTMESWANGEWLVKNLGMLVIPRAGYELAELPPGAQLLDLRIPLISSTEVRARLARGQAVTEWVPPMVEHILTRNRAI